MPTRSLASEAVPQTYAELRRGVEAVVFDGRARIEQAWLRTYHETGRLIHAHLLLHTDRADYGARTIQRLAADTGISRRVLYECVQLYRCFPIVRLTAQLTRTHYNVLCQVSDPKQREALVAQTVRNAWTVADLTSRVRAINASAHRAEASAPAALPAVAPGDLLKPQRGTPGLHRIVARGAAGGLAVDLGFKVYRMLPEGAGEGAARPRPNATEGDIVRWEADGRVRVVPEATKTDLFTYAAEVRRVIDGDTLVVAIQVAPEIWLEEKLRLRGLDCPELATPEGKAAKRFVDGLVAAARSVIIRTTKPDKYDRYLADVFLIGAETPDPKPQTPSPASAAVDTFLNHALLIAGHAERKDAWAFGDWEAGA
jgi:endonuclease YncB( thermonuclease family)